LIESSCLQSIGITKTIKYGSAWPSHGEGRSNHVRDKLTKSPGLLKRCVVSAMIRLFIGEAPRVISNLRRHAQNERRNFTRDYSRQFLKKTILEPDRFVPERHLDENGAFRKDDRITPFSVGKRACLGEGLARNEFFLFVSHLLQKFEFKPELPGKMPTINYTNGLIRAPEPFKCRAIPRN
jgi:hypothetical protein